jgi:hypothetical protein
LPVSVLPGLAVLLRDAFRFGAASDVLATHGPVGSPNVPVVVSAAAGFSSLPCHLVAIVLVLFGFPLVGTASGSFPHYHADSEHDE